MYDLPTKDVVTSENTSPVIDMIARDQHTVTQTKQPIQTRVELTPDMRFRDWASFENHFDTWKVQNFTHTYKRDSRPNLAGNADTHKHSQVRVKCVHSGTARLVDECNEHPKMRQFQSHIAKGCTFELTVKLDCDTGEYFFRKFSIEHKNHEVSEEAYASHPQRKKTG